MDSIFSKFGIYDFMGIWGPGAIFVTYFAFTLHGPIHDFLRYCGITNPGFSTSNLLLLLYTVIAYTVGVMLHELGRWLADLLGLFHASKVYSNTSNNIKHEAAKTGKYTRFDKRIRLSYEKKIDEVISEKHYKAMTFDKAFSFIKYSADDSTHRVDTFHSIYALARSLSLTFFLHCIIALVVAFLNYKVSPLYFFFDVALTILFFARTYRYHYFCVESVFMQYFYSTHPHEINTHQDTVNK